MLRLAGALPAAALLTACRETPPPRTGTGPADLLLARTAAGLTLIDARGGGALAPRRGVLAIDGSAIAWAQAAGAGTRLEVRGETGALEYGVVLPGAVTPRAVAPGGAWVALATGTADAGASYRPAGRDDTTIVIADRSGELRRTTVPGCVEPEAFSAEGQRLFVLDYLPPRQPDRYRVRMIDVATGTFGPLFTRDKTLIPVGAEEEMRGEGRQAVFAAGQRFLFTLYTHQPDHEHTRDLIAGRPGNPDVHAFVHTLSTEIGFAYCIDLPAPFGLGPAAAHAIALRPTGDPFVVDTSSGTIARLDGEKLTVAAVGRFADTSGAAAAAVISPFGAQLLYLAAGPAVRLIDTGTLETTATWSLASAARGVGVSSDGRRLWVGHDGGASALDAATGAPVASVAVPGLTTLVHVAPPGP